MISYEFKGIKIKDGKIVRGDLVTRYIKDKTFILDKDNYEIGCEYLFEVDAETVEVKIKL